jgi:Fe-Mn family superoxide dismutase
MGVTRREVLETAGWIGASTALLGTFGGARAAAQEAAGPRPPAYRGEHAVKPLPFDPKSLKGLSEKLIVSHHDNNYAGAVKRLNLIQQQLGSLPPDAPPFQFGSLKREELLAANSAALHDLYFANLGGGGAADGAAASLLRAHYGSLEAWERDFRQTALSLGGGSGWVLVMYDPADESLHNWWAWDHMHVAATGEPVLVLDMYEHAYQMDYGAAAKAYVDACFANLLWSEVNKRIERAKAKRA